MYRNVVEKYTAILLILLFIAPLNQYYRTCKVLRVPVIGKLNEHFLACILDFKVPAFQP